MLLNYISSRVLSGITVALLIATGLFFIQIRFLKKDIQNKKIEIKRLEQQINYYENEIKQLNIENNNLKKEILRIQSQVKHYMIIKKQMEENTNKYKKEKEKINNVFKPNEKGKIDEKKVIDTFNSLFNCNSK